MKNKFTKGLADCDVQLLCSFDAKCLYGTFHDCFEKGHPRPFKFVFSLFKKYSFNTNQTDTFAIKYHVPGFEISTSGSWVPLQQPLVQDFLDSFQIYSIIGPNLIDWNTPCRSFTAAYWKAHFIALFLATHPFPTKFETLQLFFISPTPTLMAFTGVTNAHGLSYI